MNIEFILLLRYIIFVDLCLRVLYSNFYCYRCVVCESMNDFHPVTAARFLVVLCVAEDVHFFSFFNRKLTVAVSVP